MDNREFISLMNRKLATRRKESPKISYGEISDGYHTFNALYHQRAILFSVICNQFPDKCFKSFRHSDGTMFENMFIVGIETPKGNFTYHFDTQPYWEYFNVPEVDAAPEWDGHTEDDALERLYSLFDFKTPEEIVQEQLQLADKETSEES